MRFEKGHKESTRRRILDVASRRFRRDGISASGLAGIMTECGLTNGAFYSHFDSKEMLIKEALSNALNDQYSKMLDTRGDAKKIENTIRRYLNISHLQGSEDGCPSAALLPEIGRQPEPTKKMYAEAYRAYVDGLAALLADTDISTRRDKAAAIFGLMVGTIQIARAMPDIQSAEETLENGVQAALKLSQI